MSIGAFMIAIGQDCSFTAIGDNCTQKKQKNMFGFFMVSDLYMFKIS